MKVSSRRSGSVPFRSSSQRIRWKHSWAFDMCLSRRSLIEPSPGGGIFFPNLWHFQLELLEFLIWIHFKTAGIWKNGKLSIWTLIVLIVTLPRLPVLLVVGFGRCGLGVSLSVVLCSWLLRKHAWTKRD